MAITNATISVNNGIKTATLTKAANGDNTLTYLPYDEEGAEGTLSETTLTSLTNGTYTSDLNIVDASKLGAKANLIVDSTVALAKTLTSVAGGKGADTFHLEGRTDDITVTGGAGKDNFIVPTLSGAEITITDYTAGQDTIQANSIESYSLSGRDVRVYLNGNSETTILKSAKDKLITFVKSDGTLLSEQSFQIGGSQEYDITNTNTGARLVTDAEFVDGSARSKAVTIELTGIGTTAQTVEGGKGADTIIASAGSRTLGTNANGQTETIYNRNYYEIAGGKGNDTFIINSDTRVTLTDYTLGGKEIIRMGAGLGYVGHDVDGNDVILNFSDTTQASLDVTASTYTPSATVRIKNGMWNQTTAEKKSYIAIVDSSGNAVKDRAGKEFPMALADPVVRYVTKVDKKNNAFDLATATNLGAEFPVDSDSYEAVTFTAATPVAITIGGGYASITTGKGKDTLIGNNVEYDPDDVTEETPIKTKYLGESSFGYAGHPSTSYNQLIYKVDFAYGTKYLRFNATKNGSKTKVTLNGEETEVDAFSISKIEVLTATTLAQALQAGTNDVTGDNVEGTRTTTEDKQLTVGVNTMLIPHSLWSISTAIVSDDDVLEGLANKLTTSILEGAGGKGIEYSYVYNPSMTYIDGGAGNDYIYSKNGGGNFFGGAGNDTLRGGNGGGSNSSSTLSGGAGNDTFLLTGEGKDIIADYNSGVMTQAEAANATTGKTSNANRKKLLGSDKIVIGYDKYNGAKNTDYNVRASLTGSSFGVDDEGNTLLNINVSGNAWTSALSTSVGTGDSARNITVPAHFANDSVYDQYAADLAQVTGYSEPSTNSSTYSVRVNEGDQINVTDQGIVYAQYVNFGATEAKVNEAFTQNYNGLLSESVVLIDAAAGKKNSRLVAGAATASVIGSAKNDTLVGNGKQVILQGGAGNDIYLVKSGTEINGIGDIIVDYSEKNAGTNKNGKDKVQVTSIKTFASQAAPDVDVVTTDFRSTGSTNTDATFQATVDGDVFTFKVDSTGKVSELAQTTKTNANWYYTLAIKDGDIIDLGTNGPATTAGQALIKAAFEQSTYTVGLTTDRTNSYASDTATAGTLKIGGIEFDNYTKGTNITFQQVDEVPTFNAKKGIYTGSKKVTQTMVRAFGDASVVSAGASTYLETFAGDIDSSVEIIKAGSKAIEIVNGADNVYSIIGSAKADTIYPTESEDIYQTVSVKSGKGNDVIVWDGNHDVVIEDMTATKYNKQGTKMSAGDIIVAKGMKNDYLTSNARWDVDDVIFTSEDGYTLTLKKAKGMAISVTSDTGLVSGIAAGDISTISAQNPHELYIDAKGTFATSQVKTSNTEGDQTWIVNATAAKAGQSINLKEITGNSVSTIYGGKGADTVHANVANNTSYGTSAEASTDVDVRIDLGAGNDIVYTGGPTYTTLTTGAGNDVIVLESDTKNIVITDYTTTSDKFFLADGVKITSAQLGQGGIVTPATGKKAAVYGSDVGLTLSYVGDGTTNTSYVTISLLPTTAGNKITRVSGDDPGAKSLAYYSLDYVSSGTTTIDSKDFSKGAIIDLAGIASSDVVVAKTAKNAAVMGGKNAAGKEIKLSVAESTTTKNAVTYYGGDTAGEYNGAAGNDVYYGSGELDIVNLGLGNDTIRQGADGAVRADITDIGGNNVYVADAGDYYRVTGFSTTDKIALATVPGSFVSSVTYVTAANSKTSGTLYINYDIGTRGEGDNNTYKGSGTIVLNNYTAGQNVNISQIGTKNGKETAPTELLTRAYGGKDLKFNDAVSANITIDADVADEWTQTINASDRKKAINIVDDKGLNAVTLGAGNDTIQTVLDNSLTVTTGAGKDVVVVQTANTKQTYTTVTDYAAGDVLQIQNAESATFFSNLTDYDKRVSVEDEDVIIKDGNTQIALEGAFGKAISVKVGTTTTTINYSDPVDVKLTAKATALDWTTENSAYDSSRVETFDASALGKNSPAKFNASGSNFTKFTGGKGADEFADNRSGSELGGITVDLGAGGGKATLNSSASADTLKYSGGSIEVINLNEGDKVEGVTSTNITKAEKASEGNKVTYTLKGGATIALTGDAVSFTESAWGDAKAKDSKKTDAGSDTFVWTKTYTVEVEGIGKYVYNTETAETTGSATAPQTSGSFDERFSDFAELVDDYVAPETNALSDITSTKVDISADDFKAGTTDLSDFSVKVTSSALTTNKKQE